MDEEPELAIHAEGKGTVFCYHSVMTSSAGIWLGENPFNFALPLLFFQIAIIFFSTRLTHSVLRHLGQPIVISQIIGGFILGPSVLGRNKTFHNLMSSPKSREQLNSTGFVAFILFLFVTGIKADLGMVRKAGKKAVAVALGSTFLPLAMVMLLGHVMKPILRSHSLSLWILITICSKWTITSYTVLSCALNELNLLTSQLGRLAMSASLLGDFFNTMVAAFFASFSLAINDNKPVIGLKALGATIGFIAFILFVIRPGIVWTMRRTPEGRLLDEGCFAMVMFLAIVCAFLSEVIGYRASMGPFVLGLVLPGGPPLGVTMVERLERLIGGVLLPVFLATSGMAVDIKNLAKVRQWGMFEMFIILCVAGKFIGAVAPCIYCRMPVRDALAVGLMMNSKGIHEIDGANLWLFTQTISREQHTVVILSTLLFGGAVAPLLKLLYRPEDRFVAYKRRTIQHLKNEGELRILVAIHYQEQVSPTICLLEASHPVVDSPICIYVLHLNPLAGRSAAVLLPYKPNRSTSGVASQSDHIIKAFFHLEQQFPSCLSVLPYICISPYATMRDDVCSLALEKKAALIVLPFHRRIAIDGTAETVSTAIQAVNVQVLKYAPCSVAILVDHGLTERITAAGRLSDNMAVYFLGGPDDREALAYAARMAKNPMVGLTVVRFRLQNGWTGEEESLDEKAVEEFRRKSTDGRRVLYREEVVQDSEGTAEVIRGMSGEFSLLIVGRREGQASLLTEGLEMWSEYPELGVVGDMLASTDFGGKVSTLVVQQQTRFGGGRQVDSQRPHRPAASQSNAS